MAQLKYVLGDDALYLYKSINPKDDKNTATTIMTTLEEHHIPTSNETMSGSKFRV